MGKFFVNQGGADIDSLDKELLKKLEEVAKRAGLKKLPLTSGKRTEKSTIRLMEDFISRGFPIRGWDSKKNKMTDEIIRSKTKPLTDFKKYPKAYSILKKGVIRDGTYKNRGEVNKAIDKLDLDDSIKKEMKDSLKAVRQNFGGLESGHLKGIKADTSLAAFKRTFGEREGADKFRVFREELEKSDLNPYFEKDNNNVLDISLYGKKSKPKKTIEDYKKEGYKPFPSELLKKDNLVMADKKGDSFFKKLVQQEAQKEIKEKKKSYDDMNFSDAFEQAMKDKGEGGVFKYKGKDILLKRAKPEIKKEPVKEKSYDDMKFSDAFEQAIKDKGEGKVFKYRGRDILLKRAKPKVEEKKPMDFQSLVKEYASKEIEPVEDVTEDIDDFQRTELMDRESELERLLKKRAAFADGGRKYEDGSEFVDNMMLDALVPEEEPSNYVEDPTREDPISDLDLDSMKFDMDKTDVVTDSITEPKLESVAEVKPPTIKEPEKANTVETIKENISPEEPVKEDKPLTMETLEQRFKDLMQASKEERKTAAWATAASQIASMIDRASANPIGIKPINFQANQASSEAKDLLALGKLKGLGVSGGDYSRDPNSDASKRARENARKLGLDIPDTMTEDELKRLMPSLLGMKRSEMLETGKAGRQDKALSLQERKFKRKIEESDRPSDKQADKIESLKFAQDLTSKIEEQLTEEMEEFLGPYASRLESAKEYIPFTDEGMDSEFAKFKANAVEKLASYIKDKSGAQVSDKERAFLEGALPSVTDKPETFKAKLAMFKERLKMVQEGRLASIKAQGKNVDEFEKMLTKPKKKITDYTESDIDNMSEEELREAGLL